MPELIILKAAAAPETSEQVITFEDLKRWIKHGQILRHVFRYSRVRLRVYRLDTTARPLGMALLLRLLSHGEVIFEDEQGRQQIVTLRQTLRFVRQFMLDFRERWELQHQTSTEVEHLLSQLPSKNRTCHLNLAAPAVYLRTDVAFGHKSGGSVAHITGVFNQLEHFTASPILITTDTIPGVATHLETHIVPFPPRFWDFSEYLTLATHHTIEAFALQKVGQRQPAFIYQRYSLNNYVGLKLAWHYDVPLVLEYNGSDVWINRHWGTSALQNEALAYQIEQLVFEGATLITVVSEPLKDELTARGISPERILLNPNGVDPEKYSPYIDGLPVRQRFKLEGKTVIGFIGTFGAWHGAEVLAAAFGHLLTQYPQYRDQVRLLLIGDGRKMPEVKHNLARYNVTEQAILAGVVPQQQGPEYLAACDILASPHIPNPDGSIFFGSPTKLFEYVAIGKGIVASDLAQVGEVVKHQETGYLVEPGNVEALAEGLKVLIDDPDLRQRLGVAARQQALEQHTWHEHTRKIINRLRELCPEQSAD